MKTEYIIEDVIIEGWMHKFATIAHSREEVETYSLKNDGKINAITINNDIDKKDYFIKAVSGLDSELSPENLYCDGELSQTEAMAKYKDIMGRIANMERASGFALRHLLQEG